MSTSIAVEPECADCGAPLVSRIAELVSDDGGLHVRLVAGACEACKENPCPSK